MAKRRSTALTVVRSVPASRPAPIRISVPRASAPAKRKSHGRRRAHGGASTKSTAIACAIGGAAVGLIEKNFPQLPTLPVVGRMGTIAIGAYMLGGNKGHGIMRDMTIAAAVLAGYQVGKEGKISGDDD